MQNQEDSEQTSLQIANDKTANVTKTTHVTTIDGTADGTAAASSATNNADANDDNNNNNNNNKTAEEQPTFDALTSIAWWRRGSLFARSEALAC
jgi:hypothetical protein